jgi:hypothetical protein
MDAAQKAFLAVNEAIMLLAAESAGRSRDTTADVAVDLPLIVHADVAAAQIVITRRDSGVELYRVSHPQ